MQQHYTTNKGLLKIFVFVLSLIIVFVSCSKKNDSVQPVPSISSGSTIAIPSVGPAGPGNNVMYYASTCPDASAGSAGDFFLNTSQGILYGPKSVSGWGLGLKMKNSAAAESLILSGSGAPASTLGNTGDYYLDISNFVLYGAKCADGWGAPFNLYVKQQG
ncbi:MAG TPA: hypothetical protein VKT28_16140 [Puia sp.]|nr:hypothetical protein [Puia sp.]